MAAAIAAALRFGTQRRVWLALVLWTGACVDKAPPPMWPAPPPPRVATPIHADEAPAPTVQVPGIAVAPTPAAPPVPLDAAPAEASILDPAGPAAAALPKGTPTPRPVPTHR